MKITDFKILGTRLGTTLHHYRLILEMETELETKSRFHYLCHRVVYKAQHYYKQAILKCQEL